MGGLEAKDPSLARSEVEDLQGRQGYAELALTGPRGHEGVAVGGQVVVHVGVVLAVGVWGEIRARAVGVDEDQVGAGVRQPVVPEPHGHGAVVQQGGAALVDNTDASYDLLTASASASGAFSLHLAHPAAESESFELDSSFIPSATSTLIFSSRLGYATDDETVMVQISLDDGRSWQTLYSESGSNGSGQSSFSPRSIPLAPFADSFVRIRFLYHYDGGYFYDCTGAQCGLLVDDIEVVDALEVIDSTVTPLGAEPEFTFTKDSAYPGALSIRAVPWNGYPAVDWGPLFYLPATPERVELGDAIEMLSALAAGSTQYTLTDVLEVLQVLTGQ